MTAIQCLGNEGVLGSEIGRRRRSQAGKSKSQLPECKHQDPSKL